MHGLIVIVFCIFVKMMIRVKYLVFLTLILFISIPALQAANDSESIIDEACDCTIFSDLNSQDEQQDIPATPAEEKEEESNPKDERDKEDEIEHLKRRLGSELNATCFTDLFHSELIVFPPLQPHSDTQHYYRITTHTRSITEPVYISERKIRI